jgi:hypothetical protein
MKKDPLDVPHIALARQARWLSCLGCHDFHGNHLMAAQTRMADAFDARQIERYFEGGASPYPARLRKPPSKQRADRDD